MNNKGFTLVELIATIALLAVIATISFVSINSIVNDNKVKNCKTLINNIKMAAKEYVSDNRYKNLDFHMNNADTKVVKIGVNSLLSNDYLKGNIIDPYTNDNMDISDVNVFVKVNKNYVAGDIILCKNNDINKISCGDNSFDVSSICKFD